MQAEPSPAQQAQHAGLAPFLRDRYPAVKAQHPGEGRRKWRLRAADAFWALPPDAKTASLSQAGAADADEDAEFVCDDDPLDAASTDAPGLGILVRTDFSNDQAWHAFRSRLQEGEAEFAPARAPAGDAMEEDAAGSASGNTPAPTADDDAMNADDDDDEEDEGPPAIFSVIDPSPADRPRWTGLSNLAALRLLNDVDVRRAPRPDPGAKRIRPPNRLVDHDGWQEVYAGKTVWIYDARSNADQCVRLVGQQSGPYGTATADSWRARVSHVCELQVNLATGAMTIDFGGLDRWDYEERVRNMEEAMRPAN